MNHWLVRVFPRGLDQTQRRTVETGAFSSQGTCCDRRHCVYCTGGWSTDSIKASWDCMVVSCPLTNNNSNFSQHRKMDKWLQNPISVIFIICLSIQKNSAFQGWLTKLLKGYNRTGANTSSTSFWAKKGNLSHAMFWRYSI